jgi:hypothetical protein
MEDFSFENGSIGVPLSLSTIGRKYVKSIWKDNKYNGYQISPKYPLGDVSVTMTPKGLNKVKDVGFVLPYYIANYKGGRNESFMYGIDRDTTWYDYDLTSAYTTVMSMAGHPEYDALRPLTPLELSKLSRDEILYSYLIIHADFEFNSDTKYPSIACFVDESCTIFPKTGSCVITGAEYLLANSQGCKFVFKSINLIPFKEYGDGDMDKVSIKPFETVIKLVQEKRREYPKGSISNLMYKEIGNSIYGSVVRGISNKMKLDTKTNSMQRMRGDDLSNPLIASWTTAFIRSIIGECLQGIQDKNGKVVSVTTDGFITNLADLESLIHDGYLLSCFKGIRSTLSGDDAGLELKNSGVGMLSWCTRGQLGIESKIIATTGFQRSVYNKGDMLQIFTDVVSSDTKTIEYIQSRLRSATDVFKQGGHVVKVYRDQQFRLQFDNKRVLNNADFTTGLIDSTPLHSVKHGENLRFISKLPKMKQYSKFSGGITHNKYKNLIDLGIRNFLKGLLSTTPLFNLHKVDIGGYKEIINFIKGFDPTTKLTPNSLAKLKGRDIKIKSVPRLKEVELFVQYVKTKYPQFNDALFWRLS